MLAYSITHYSAGNASALRQLQGPVHGSAGMQGEGDCKRCGGGVYGVYRRGMQEGHALIFGSLTGVISVRLLRSCGP